jgi:hypothetical protein
MECKMDFENRREPTPEEYRKRREAEIADKIGRASGAGQVATQEVDTASQYGLKQGVNRLMDKRIVQGVLHQKASELRAQADGLERLAELVGAAANHDMTLFSAVLTLLDRR